MSEKQVRNKVTWFSFLFSLLVIWVHSYNAQLFLGSTEDMVDVYRIEYWIGDMFGQVAVPGFFMISGYLFYRNFDWSKLEGKWRRRIHSVLLPYLLWNFIYYLGYAAASRVPWVRDVVGKGVVPFTPSAAVDAVLHYTYNYVFWYLYQLIFLILLAPVLYPLLKGRWRRAVFLALLWLLVVWEIDLPLINEDALLYYATAAAIALGAADEDSWEAAAEGRWSVQGAIAGAAMAAAAALCYWYGLRAAFVAGFVMSRVLAVAGLWLLVPGDKLPEAKWFTNNLFFLYATHFAFVRLINKTAARLFPVTKWEPLALYLMMPFLALAISRVLGGILRKYAPVCWKLLNGGR